MGPPTPPAVWLSPSLLPQACPSQLHTLDTSWLGLSPLSRSSLSAGPASHPLEPPSHRLPPAAAGSLKRVCMWRGAASFPTASVSPCSSKVITQPSDHVLTVSLLNLPNSDLLLIFRPACSSLPGMATPMTGTYVCTPCKACYPGSLFPSASGPFPEAPAAPQALEQTVLSLLATRVPAPLPRTLISGVCLTHNSHTGGNAKRSVLKPPAKEQCFWEEHGMRLQSPESDQPKP